MIGVAFRDAFELAIRGLKNRKLRSALTMIGIFIGIASVVSLISLGQGMSDAINTQFASLGTDKIIIQASSGGLGPPGTSVVNKLTTDDISIVESARGVKLVTRRMIRSLEFEFDDENAFGFGVSLPEDPKEARLVIEANNYVMESGRMLKKSDQNKVVLGSDYATRNVFEKNLEVGDKVLVNNKEVEVVGILERRGNFQSDGSIVFPEDVLREIVFDEDEVDIIIAQIGPSFSIEAVSNNIEKALRKDRNEDVGEETFSVSTPQDILATINSVLFIVQAVVIGIAFISLFVGGVGIMNTMYTSVLERTKQIGVMKAIGARNGAILQLFIMEAGLVGTVGGLVGVLIGVGFSKLVEFGATRVLGSSLIQASITPSLIVGALLFSFIIGALSGAVPAYQASRLKPADVLRYE